MLERPDAVLTLIPLLAVSGLGIRTLLAAPTVGTGLVTAPLAVAGYLAALAVVFLELLAWPVAERVGGS
ncbi:hypothetical protein C488_08917 [Natrinema pellirubrum DSM 15624]|uniref:Uncharacterized protein n=2 Tax=Natrinema TaxID=88723 RepID=L0JQV5_NATP1|nr:MULTISPECIES: hypothetical protein [Natrinema]AGB32756.1 hypothetical protein Natpe_2959 [Natrinema pellirubrum DSM 15624]ELY75759.1 hypothetical protein C488_08917 [Natrinema pellirubrum DSM 15624]QCC58022.1 hypothetical protein DVR14_04930 [Natrinema thermotolerans]WMT09115.1 hypothetical protein NP511_05640 [Natrinema thermotolerans]